jgi:hypothetical protein
MHLFQIHNYLMRFYFAPSSYLFTTDILEALDLLNLAQAYFAHNPLMFSLMLGESFSAEQNKTIDRGIE